MNKRFFLILAAASILAACDGGPRREAQGQEGSAKVLPAGHAHVQCGCSIPGIGICGDYVEVEGTMLELVYPEGVDLGPMPFCGQDDLTAQVEGEVVDGKFVASSFALIEPEQSGDTKGEG